ncbi:MAG: DUF2252 family protein [Planctomycetes bacterium]|nr:DUF2252 family protein [Planctomycetota bacterium]
MRDPVAEFQAYNCAFARRNPELLRLKVERMAASPFAFFRGTFHLFARDILEGVFATLAQGLHGAAEVDLVGDLHAENYGTFRGADGIVHYDINDFDETTQGRFDVDVNRQAASLLLAARERGDSLTDAVLTALAFLTRYTETVKRLLKKGRNLDLDVSEKTSSGARPVDQLVRTAAANKRSAFIEKLTKFEDGRRQVLRSLHYFNLPDDEREQALRLLEDYRRRLQEPSPPEYFQVEDVCGRVSGIGSMGRLRYVVLIAGKGSADGRNRLLEFKEARPSAYDLHRGRDTDAGALAVRAERVIAVQRASQASSNSRLGFALDGGQSFQARELGPREARVDLKGLPSTAALQEVGRVQADILARTHARAAARVVGVANPLAELGDGEAFCERTLAFALAYADLARQDWGRFVGRRAEIDRCEEWAGQEKDEG